LSILGVMVFTGCRNEKYPAGTGRWISDRFPFKYLKIFGRSGFHAIDLAEMSPAGKQHGSILLILP